MSKLYYTPPSDEIFEEVKKAASQAWLMVSDDQKYLDEKLSRIKDLENVSDNFMYMVVMFDYENQCRLSGLLTSEARKAISDRMNSGGQPDLWNPFLQAVNPE